MPVPAKLSLERMLELAYTHRWKDAKDGDRSYARACRLALSGPLLGVGTTVNLRAAAIALQKEHNLSPASVNRHVAAYLGMLDTLVDLGELERSDIPKWRALRESNGRDYCPSDEDVDHFTHTACRVGDRSIRSLAYLLAETGLRLGEALALTAEDLVHHNGRSFLTVVESKSGHSRLVPLPELHLLAAAGDLAYALEAFSSLSRSTVYRCWHQVREAAGLPAAFTPHALRHYRASKLAAAGVSIPTIAAILGHRDWKTTQRYTHVDHATMADAVDMVSAREAEVYDAATDTGNRHESYACSCPEDEVEG